MRELTPEDDEPVDRSAVERLGGTVPTIYDVASAAGVSKSVVSRALSGAPGVAARTVTKVTAAAEAIGYVANANARGMSARRTHTLGVFVRDAATPFYGHLLTAFQEQASARGYRAVTATGSGSFSIEEERRALETLVSLRVEGLIVCSGALPVSDIIPFARRIPTVIAGRPEEDPGVSSVYCDELGGGRGLAEHITRLGHRRVAVMTHTVASSITQAARTEAMVRSLRDAGVDVLAFRCEEFDINVENTDAIVQAILDAGGVTAVMASSDSWAVSVLESLRRRGLSAPQNMSVTGYDGVRPLTTSLLGLTSWHQPLKLIGRLSVDDVVDQIDGLSRGARHRSISGELIAGRTAAAV